MSKSRLNRLDEFFADQPLIFITFCTHNRRPILANAMIHETFRTFCQAAETRHHRVGRYVIMPDHIHLFVQLQSPAYLSTWIKTLKNSLSKTLRQTGELAPHWQKDFFDHVLRTDESYEAKWNYVAQNPLRDGLVKRLEDWAFQGEIVSLSFT
jgi:REP element-mobilizing transposase RayT